MNLLPALLALKKYFLTPNLAQELKVKFIFLFVLWQVCVSFQEKNSKESNNCRVKKMHPCQLCFFCDLYFSVFHVAFMTI
jgi:hypothetical protein